MIYAYTMTLSQRNDFFKAGIFVASVFLIIITALSFIILPVYASAVSETTQRSAGIFQFFITPFLQASPHASFASMASAVIYAFTTIILIYYFFEQTQSPEILFFAIFVISFSFEGIRVMVPLKIVYGLSNVYLMMGSRILLFARYFGIFSLFTASVYASGLEVQKQRNTLLVITVADLMIALGVPIDGFVWDSSLSMISGYPTMFNMVELGIIIISAVSFFVSAYSRGTKEYMVIGLGALFSFFGRNMLLSSDTWVTLLPGLLFLALGTWFVCTQLHRVYLWF
ncbi:MAG: hypothetical protein LBP42_04925 [Treponema sp.]|jgi:hypothetical protein|nr:hypothetical protein [Treponema sp.]